MKNTFGEALMELRKKKFPGQSLRKVGETLTNQYDFKKFFYTQLNKIEIGVILPSSELLNKLLNAYDATTKERESAVKAYALQLTEEKVRMVAEDTNVAYPKVKEAVFYRKRAK